MWIIRLALNRPYTFVVASIGFTSIATTPADFFPNIDIPVVTVIWSTRSDTSLGKRRSWIA
ncbi:hypothetical protein BDD14_1420 [Edaphobacter modestus]|uniref:AcrB/AcrD/AcrF family protein n=1 Tax=Edaphobacter modestus TaxID=388466 RepID=A0A4V2G491_9BACT|nr:hypothetical protein BDD14_1420 [Edaphobacter modestus]